jgi:hypothetical protein
LHEQINAKQGRRDNRNHLQPVRLCILRHIHHLSVEFQRDIHSPQMVFNLCGNGGN